MRVLAALLGLSLLGASAAVSAQQPPPLEVSEVIAVEGKSTAQLCNGARDWVATAFRNSRAVVEVFDAERGKLIGKGGMQVLGWGGTPFNVHFTLTVDCKDGRLRAAFTEYLIDDRNSPGTRYPMRQDSMNNLPAKAASQTQELVAGLRQHLSRKDDF